jgi:hypothetical protein
MTLAAACIAILSVEDYHDAVDAIEQVAPRPAEEEVDAAARIGKKA